ncbi:MAG: Flp family type IVb pilin [Alphaproteobacteria bacterium]|nr:Flp family type IVb pilin [Alphaproteobacteria bacterium]
MVSPRVRNALIRLWRCSRGVTSLEYALMAAIISTATVTTVISVGQRLDNTFRYTLAAFGDDGEDEAVTKEDPAVEKVAAKVEKETAKAAAAAEKAAAKEAAEAEKEAAKAAAKAAKEAAKKGGKG